MELAAGGHVTPLARDTLNARRISVVPAGSVDPTLPGDLAPTADIRRVAIASDHTGVALKTRSSQHLRGRGLAVDDLGTDGAAPVDYPDMAARVRQVRRTRRGRRGHRHRRRRHRVGHCGQQGQGHSRGDVHRRNASRGIRANTTARTCMTLGSTLLAGPTRRCASSTSGSARP